MEYEISRFCFQCFSKIICFVAIWVDLLKTCAKCRKLRLLASIISFQLAKEPILYLSGNIFENVRKLIFCCIFKNIFGKMQSGFFPELQWSFLNREAQFSSCCAQADNRPTQTAAKRTISNFLGFSILLVGSGCHWVVELSILDGRILHGKYTSDGLLTDWSVRFCDASPSDSSVRNVERQRNVGGQSVSNPQSTHAGVRVPRTRWRVDIAHLQNIYFQKSTVLLSGLKESCSLRGRWCCEIRAAPARPTRG